MAAMRRAVFFMKDSGYAESHAPLGVVKPRGLKNGPCAERRGLDTSQPDDACRAGIETVTKHHFFPFISTWETPP